MPHPDAFHLIVTLNARSADDIAPVAEALARMRPLCLAEPGCLAWEAFQSQAVAGQFFLVETWASRADWEAHGQLSAIQTIYLPEVLPRVTRTAHPSLKLG